MVEFVPEQISIEFARERRRRAVAIEPEPAVFVDDDGVLAVVVDGVSLRDRIGGGEVRQFEIRILEMIRVRFKHIARLLRRGVAVVPRPVGKIEGADLTGWLARSRRWKFRCRASQIDDARMVPPLAHPFGVFPGQFVALQFLAAICSSLCPPNQMGNSS